MTTHDSTKEFYFLVDITDPVNPLFGSLFFRCEEDNKESKEIKLQMIRDTDWSFELPDKPLKHHLYKYIPPTSKSRYEHKYDIKRQFKENHMDHFEFIGEFIVDPTFSQFNEFNKKYLELKETMTNSLQHGTHELYHEYIVLNGTSLQFTLKLTYHVSIYLDQYRINTMICLPTVIISDYILGTLH